MDEPKGNEVSVALNEIKTLESRGFTFEAAEASAIMLLKRQEAGYQAPFELIDFKVEVEHRPDGGIFSEAMVIIQVGRDILRTNSDGDGPVNALDKALRKALVESYPEIGLFHLADYKVRILDGENGTRAITRVLIDTQNHAQRWSTVGASSNIIEASWLALVDSFEYGLTLKKGAGTKQ